MKCQSCHKQKVFCAWQPFGPDEAFAGFAFLGNHYRGFPVIKVCESCKAAIERGDTLTFSYRGNTFCYTNGTVAKTER